MRASIRATIVLVVTSSIAGSPANAADLTPAFTYQGVLTDGGTPAQGPYDLRLTLFDLAAGGSQVGPVLTLEDQPVSDGRFTVLVDFGPVFDMTALWVEVAVREGASTGAFDVLAPRVQLTAAPQAWYSVTSGDAVTLAGQPAAYYLDWSNLSGIPLDIADGDDDTLGGLVCAPDGIARWTGSEWQCDEDRNLTLTRTRIVSPGDDSLQNGTILLTAVGSPGPSTFFIEPGFYNLGELALDVPTETTLVGVPGTTWIYSSVCSYPVVDQPSTATVVLNANSRLQGLAIGNTCAEPTATAIAVLYANASFATAYLDNVEMRANGSAGECIGLHSSGSLEARDSFGFADCGVGGTDYGIVIEGSGLPSYVELTNCWAVTTRGGAGIRIGDTSGGTVIVRGVQAAAAAAGAALKVDAGEVVVMGSRMEGPTSISVSGGAFATITNSTFAGTIAIDGSGTAVQLDAVTPDPLSGFAPLRGMNVTGEAAVRATSSRFGTVTVGPGTVRLGASQVQHVTVNAGGGAICAGVFSSDWTFYPATCP